MFMVYWSEAGSSEPRPHAQAFASDQMVAAMQFAEALRARQRAGEALRFITLCSENPDSVGQAGVAETGADYQWKKRRR